MQGVDGPPSSAREKKNRRAVWNPNPTRKF
jgi:hypothetical protein